MIRRLAIDGAVAAFLAAVYIAAWFLAFRWQRPSEPVTPPWREPYGEEALG